MLRPYNEEEGVNRAKPSYCSKAVRLYQSETVSLIERDTDQLSGNSNETKMIAL
jgi:hypothetical protein